MLLPRAGGLGAFLYSQCVPQTAPVIQTLQGPPRFNQLCLCHSCHHHSLCTELDLPQEVPWEGKGRSICTAAAGGSMHISVRPLRPSHPAARRIISSSLLQHRQLNSTAFYLWFPHDASGSAGQQGRDLWRRDKTQCVHKPDQKASPGAARESHGCSVS